MGFSDQGYFEPPPELVHIVKRRIFVHIILVTSLGHLLYLGMRLGHRGPLDGLING